MLALQSVLAFQVEQHFLVFTFTYGEHVFRHMMVLIHGLDRCVHSDKERLQVRRFGLILRQVTADQSLKPFIPILVHHTSLNVVIVMVWLCSSHPAPGLKGEISP
jgi:uncharacterized protein YbbC (DUF1343 family)